MAEPIDLIVGEGSENGTNMTVEKAGDFEFISSGYAYVISGVFVWSALFLTSFQVRCMVQ